MKTLSLRIKATLMVLLLMIAAIGGSSIVGMWSIGRMLDANHARDTQVKADNLAYTCQLALAVRDRQELGRLAHSFASEPAISFVAIYADGDDEPLVREVNNEAAWSTYLKGTIDLDHHSVAESRVALSDADNDPLSVFEEPGNGASPSSDAGRTLGHVVIGHSHAPIHAVMAQFKATTFAATVLAVSLGALGMYLAVAAWSRRLDMLVDASDELSRGDFDVSIPESSTDEVGRLAGAFDHMRRALGQRQRELRELNENLQQRVEQRTSDLAMQRQMLRDVIDNIPHAVFWMKRDGELLGCNRNFAQFVNLAHPSDVVGRNRYDLIKDSAVADHLRDLDHGVMRHGKPITREETLTGRDGASMCLLTSKVPMHDGAGNIVGVLGILADITELKRIEKEREQLQSKFAEASRQAGMAEVATSVLHNVGNVLNSVNVSSTVITDRLRESRLPALDKSLRLIDEHRGTLDVFLEADERGRQLLPFMHQLADLLHTEQQTMLGEVRDLSNNIDHIKQIIAMQQSLAKSCGVIERVAPVDMVEDALRINAAAFQRHGIAVEKRYAPDLPGIQTDRHKVIQILVNLISNARHAMTGQPADRRRLLVEVAHEDNAITFQVTDRGVGISPDHLRRVFQHGFTTRADGHGFGLHHGANASKELGGRLTAHSDGEGRGASFTLTLPLTAPEPTGLPR